MTDKPSAGILGALKIMGSSRSRKTISSTENPFPGLQSLGIRPIPTDIADIETAGQAVMDDTIIDHVEQLH